MGPPGVAEVTAASVARGRQAVRSRITRQIELHSTLKRVVDVDARFRTSLSTFFSSFSLIVSFSSLFLLLLPLLLLLILPVLLFFLLLWVSVFREAQYHSFSSPPIFFLIFSFFVL